MTRNMNLYSKLILLVLMAFGTTSAWGQTDFSGIYYIGSIGYNAGTPANNYYLCPTEGWCYYQATDNFWPSNTADENKSMPFLTTYQCRNGVYDATKAVWVIEKAPNSAYYYIKQKKTGKYLVSNGVIQTTSSGWDRMRVHLETVANPSDKGNSILFNIYEYSTYLVIQSIGIEEPASGYHNGHNNHRWLTVNGGNSNSLLGASGKGNGPTGYANTKGIIGIYTEDDTNAPFYLEDVPVPAPTFTVNADGTVAISCSEAGTTIRYTLDGTDPTTSSTAYSSALPSLDVPAAPSVKAIAVRTIGSQTSPVATLPVVTYN